MKRIIVFLGMFLLLATGCSKTGEQGPLGPQGPQGPTGPTGPGYSEVTMQPGPGDTKGKDSSISTTIGNWGSQPTILFGYLSGTANAARALMYFDISQAGIPAGSTIVSATLTLYPSTGATTGNLLTAQIFPIVKGWAESGVTWTQSDSTNNWSNAGGDFQQVQIGSFIVDPGTTSKITVNLDTSYVQNWLNGQVNYGFMIKSNNENLPDSNLAVFSRDYSIDPTKRPSLKLIYK